MSVPFAIANTPIVGVTCPDSMFGQHVFQALRQFPVISHPMTGPGSVPARVAYLVCGDLLYKNSSVSAIQPWLNAAREKRCPILLCLPSRSPMGGVVLEHLRRFESRHGITDYRLVLAPDLIDATDMPSDLAPLSHVFSSLPDRTLNQLLPADRLVSPVSLTGLARYIPRILFSQALNHRVIRLQAADPYPAINYYLHLKQACDLQTGVSFTLLPSPNLLKDAVGEVGADHILTLSSSFPAASDLRLLLTPVLVPPSHPSLAVAPKPGGGASPPSRLPSKSESGTVKIVRRPRDSRRFPRYLKPPLFVASLYVAWLVLPLTLVVVLSSSMVVNHLFTHAAACDVASRLSPVLDRLVQAQAVTVPPFLSRLPAAESGLRSGRDVLLAQCRVSHSLSALVNDSYTQGFAASGFSSLNTELEWLNRLTSLFPAITPPSDGLTGGSALRWSRLSRIAAYLLSQPQPATLLVVYQDPSEMRPSGGFVRELQKITLNRGRLAVGPRQTPNELDRYLQGEVAPPPDLQGVMGERRWYLRDANWWADVPRSARSLAWFYEKETNQPVQGVILVNAAVDLGFVSTLSTRPLPVLNRLDSLLLGKDIQVWLADASFERLLMDNGWAGEWEGHFCNLFGVGAPETFALSETNIGLLPVIGDLNRRATHDVTLDASGLHHTHTFTMSGESLSTSPNPYQVYLRWYLPPDASLDGVRLNGQAVLPSQLVRVTENCLEVVGVTATVSASMGIDTSIAYTRPVTPESLSTRYGFRLLKQPGVPSYPVKLGVTLPVPLLSPLALDDSLSADRVHWVELQPGL